MVIAQDDQAKLNVEFGAIPSAFRNSASTNWRRSFLRGTSDRTAKEFLAESAYEMIRIGQSPKIGTTFHLPFLSRTITIANHRTAAPTGRMLGFREFGNSSPLDLPSE